MWADLWVNNKEGGDWTVMSAVEQRYYRWRLLAWINSFHEMTISCFVDTRPCAFLILRMRENYLESIDWSLFRTIYEERCVCNLAELRWLVYFFAVWQRMNDRIFAEHSCSFTTGTCCLCVEVRHRGVEFFFDGARCFLMSVAERRKNLDASEGGQMTVVKPGSNCHECQLLFVFI